VDETRRKVKGLSDEMIRRYVARKLVQRLSEKVQSQLNLRETLILGVVLKGLPVAYCLARMNGLVKNFVPIVAHRPLHMQYHVESCFPSPEWQAYFKEQLDCCESTLVVDDVVNTGFTKQRVESTIFSLIKGERAALRFAALVLNAKNLANLGFINSDDLFALRVNAEEVECDWGLVTVPLWDLPIKEARMRCERYLQRFWLEKKRFITVTY
jgi:adenine/guanine phosphoribosyltransferase-like PRPP-binding protein